MGECWRTLLRLHSQYYQCYHQRALPTLQENVIQLSLVLHLVTCGDISLSLSPADTQQRCDLTIIISLLVSCLC